MPKKIRKMIKRGKKNGGRSLRDRKNNSVSDCCGESDAIIPAVELRVVAGDEVGTQNPDGTHGGRNIQTSEGNDADVSLNLWLLEPT